MPSLKTLFGNDTTIVSLEDGPTWIGRSQQSHLRVPLPVVSKVHAVVHCSGSHCTLENKGTNGTYLNDRRITEPEPLKHGDKIRIATATILFLEDNLEDSSGFRNDPLRTIVPENIDDPEVSLRRTAIPQQSSHRTVTLSGLCAFSEDKIRESFRMEEQSATTLVSRDSGKVLSQMLKLLRALELYSEHGNGDLVAEEIRSFFPQASELVIVTGFRSFQSELTVWGATGNPGQSVALCADLVQRVALNSECLLVSDLWRQAPGKQPMLSQMGRVSLICIPVRSARGECNAVVQLLASNPNPEFESADLGRLAILAQLLTMRLH